MTDPNVNTPIPPSDCPSIFERSCAGRRGCSLPAEPSDTAAALAAIPAALRRKHAAFLPEVAEVDVTRHYTKLAGRTLGLDTAFYPLGSCTMKYNPRMHELAAGLDGFRRVHPEQPQSTMQGLLQVLYETQTWLAELTGLPAVSMQPAAGAHGELAAMMVVRSYFEARGETERRTIVLPDTAHGTNPATSARAGMSTVEIKSSENGRVDLDALRQALNGQTACVMITNPNTLGLFEDRIHEVAKLVHDAGALLYIDGANFNAIIGRVRPADFGADLIHLNLHKTFSSPHGGGGPGSGPICGRDFLAPFMPRPYIVKRDDGTFALDSDRPQTTGKVRAFIGNLPAIVRTWCYLRELGAEGCRETSGIAVLNANYIRERLAGVYDIPFGPRCMHEFVLSAQKQKEQGARALDLAKGLIDMGYHPPTIYFPLLVAEAMMIEPTETENKVTLDAFSDAMIELAKIAETDASSLCEMPKTTVVRRLDEGQAARQPVLVWPYQEKK